MHQRPSAAYNPNLENSEQTADKVLEGWVGVDEVIHSAIY